MIAVLSFVSVVVLFVTAARVATIALVGTGMSTESASFQARSALMGVGYTTAEAESVVNHPVRRKIVLWLMTFGNAGIITGITSMLLGFVGTEADQALGRAALLVVGLAVLSLLARVSLLERGLKRATHWALAKWTTLETRDFTHLLRFEHDYGIIELVATGDDWLVDRPLAELGLPDEGIAVLGLHRREGAFIGAPTGRTVIRSGDVVLAYGRLDHLEDLDHRARGRRGDRAHREMVHDQQGIVAEQQLLDAEITGADDD